MAPDNLDSDVFDPHILKNGDVGPIMREYRNIQLLLIGIMILFLYGASLFIVRDITSVFRTFIIIDILSLMFFLPLYLFIFPFHYYLDNNTISYSYMFRRKKFTIPIVKIKTIELLIPYNYLKITTRDEHVFRLYMVPGKVIEDFESLTIDSKAKWMNKHRPYFDP